MTHEYLPALYAPVLLGGGRDMRRLARRLFWSYSLTSHWLTDRQPFFRILSPWIVHRRLPKEAGEDMCSLALRHLAAELLACDRQPILLLGEQASGILSPESLSRLENSYLICREDELASLFQNAALAQGGTTV